MSYINDALRKAQKERDRGYEQFHGIIASCSEGSGQHRNKRLTIMAAVTVLVLIPAGVLLAVYVLDQPGSVRQKPAVAVAVEAPVAVLPVDKGKVAETGQAGTTQATLPTAKPAAVSTVTVPAKVSAKKQTEKAVIVTEKKAEAKIKASATTASSGKTGSISGTVSPRDAQEAYQEALYTQRNLDVKGAETLYQRTLEFDPNHVRAMNNLGVIFMEKKKWEQAIVMFNRAIVLKKDYIDPYYNLSCLYARKNKIDESLFYLKAAAAVNGGVIEWARKDADMKNVVASREFKKMMEDQKN
jgi:Tfp pilus assembly protein PilF